MNRPHGGHVAWCALVALAFGIVGRLGLVVIAIVVWAVPGRSQAPDVGPSATYKNDTMHFSLGGNNGTLVYQCTRCGRWHQSHLVYERQGNFSWPNGDKFAGQVYKVRGMDRWYFLSNDSVATQDENGNDVRRHPIAVSTTSSRQGFSRILRPGGTSRLELTKATVAVTDDGERPGLPSGDGDAGGDGR